MNVRVNELILYRNFDEDILIRLSGVVNQYNRDQEVPDPQVKARMIDDIYECIGELVTISREHGFEGNLWHGYLTYLLTTNENAFSMSCEKKGPIKGNLNAFALHDLSIFQEAYQIDWKDIEDKLQVDFFSLISNYEGIANRGLIYSKSLRERVDTLNLELAGAEDAQQMYEALTDFYRDFGVGKFGLHRAFKITSDGQQPHILPITKTDKVQLEDLIGYEIQKKKLINNTEAFVKGERANNVLLYGDSGTGKSTSIKAILNRYYKDGLRMIEIYKHQFKDISNVIAQIKNRNYKFILYMDDLSFEEFEIEYKFLKAVIEGGLETKPSNVLIYATSNRRHLIKEVWDERRQNTQDVHGGDSMQEKLSLATRFGESIYYEAPSQKEFLVITSELARRYGITMSEKDVEKEAVAWEMSHGGLSGRTAQQFINHLVGRQALNH